MKLIDNSTNIDEFSFSDLDMTFKIHPSKRDLIVKKDLAAITKAMTNLLLTNHYERPFHPEIGSNLRRFLFENSDSVTFALAEREIKNVLINFEPRIQLVKIEAKRDNENGMFIEIDFYMGNSVEISSIQIPLGRNVI